MYALPIVVAAGLVGARIVTAPGSFSVNDRSRWATIRALVETGSYSIGREEAPDGAYRDLGIVTQPGWESVDIVMDPLRGGSTRASRRCWPVNIGFFATR